MPRSAWIFCAFFLTGISTAWGSSEHWVESPSMSVVTDTILFCTELGNAALPANNQSILGEEDPQATSCSVHVWMVHNITEPCGSHVTYDVRLYMFGAGNPIWVVQSGQANLDSDHHGALRFDTRDSSLPPDDSITLNGLPYTTGACNGLTGLHKLVWTVYNECGVQSSYTYMLRVEDCFAPRVICSGLASIALPSSGTLIVRAGDFVSTVIDDCTPSDSLQYSFEADAYVPTRRYTCDSILCNGGPTFFFGIWVADHGRDQNCDGVIDWSERNRNSCYTVMLIDKNGIFCEPYVINGSVGDDQGEPGGPLTVYLTRHGEVLQSQVISINSSFHFTIDCPDDVQDSMVIHCEKNDNAKDGVSTLDLIKIQKHLLGLQLLTSPYQVIAADANNSENISVQDLVEIRKLILGIYSGFPHNQSWRFVPEDYAFQDTLHPWPFPDSILIPQGSGYNFIPIKIGDVNGTLVGYANQVQTRSVRRVLKLEVNNSAVRAGEKIEVPIRAENFQEILGFQMTLETRGLWYTGVTPGGIDMLPGYIADQGDAITMSWANFSDIGHPVSINNYEKLFTLHFEASASGSLSDMLTISSRITEAEAYRNLAASPDESPFGRGRAFGEPTSVSRDNAEYLDVRLVISSTPDDGKNFALYQNLPNPFSDETIIGFTLPEAMPARLTVFDLNGMVVFTTEEDYAPGFHRVILKAKDIGVNGVYYYRLEAGDFIASRKFILTE